VTDDMVEALADAFGAPIPSERRASVAVSLESQLAGQGGATPDEVEGVEPATVFEPGWER
jgi:hypothetical protein